MDQVDNLNPKSIRVEEGDNTEKIMIGETAKVGTGQIMQIDWINIDQTLGEDPDMTAIIEMETLEAMWDSIKILRDRTVGENIKITTDMTVIPEIEVGVNLGKGQYPEALITEEMIGVQVTVGLDQDQE